VVSRSKEKGTKGMIKRIATGAVALLVAFLPLAGTVSAATSTTNPIANPSMESGSTTPSNWTSNSWGTNTSSFSYESSDAQDGSKSLKVTTTAYTDGDAKWFADAVAITAGSTYTYSEYYKATVATTLVAAFQDAAGNYSYVDMTPAAAASAWTKYSADVTAPANAAKVSVYHVLMAVGTLQIDNVALADAITLPPANGSLAIANASGELTSDNQTPLGWTKSSWSDPVNAFTATHQYVTNDGHDGSKSMKVTVSGYDRTYSAGEGGIGGVLSGDQGDAKWMFTPITVGNGTDQLQAGKQYRISFWYKASNGVIPKVVSMSCIDDAAVCENVQYFGMPNPLTTSETTWTKYTDTFSVPTNAKAVSVFAFIDQNGWIQTDDYSIEAYTPSGFNEALLSLTYDDGHEDNVRNLLPLLAKSEYSSIKTTQCFETVTLQTQAATQSNLKAFQNAGHEICSHTINHPMLTQISSSQLATELQDSKTYLEQVSGVAVPNFASPYGDYNQAVIAAIKAAGYSSHRTVDEGYNSKDNYDPYRIRVQNIGPTTTAAQVSEWIAHAKADKTWLVLVYHRVVDTTDAAEEAPGAFDTTKELMEQHLAAIKASGIKVETMAQALATTKAQINGTNPPADTTKPVISGVTTGTAAQTSMNLSWLTNENTTSKVEYGTSTAYGAVVADTAANTSHTVTVSGLTASTKYYYRITATDAAGNASTVTGEYTTAAVSTSPTKLGDITKDGVINDDDATILFANWGANPKAGDLDNNGVVDDDDATLLFANWSK
jgi:peptidoglycan/xylan/chitin deacetylase (PgdA/CDA1 family)